MRTDATIFNAPRGTPWQVLEPLPGGGLALAADAPPIPPAPPFSTLSGAEDDDDAPNAERMEVLRELAHLRSRRQPDDENPRVGDERLNELRSYAGLPAR